MTEHNTDDRIGSSTELAAAASNSLERMTDEELLLEYRMTGGSGVFEALVKRYERELYNYLRRFLNNQVLAEDAFQATFMQVHLKCHLFDSERKVRPWLYTVATNQAIDIQRRNRRHRRRAAWRRGQPRPVRCGPPGRRPAPHAASPPPLGRAGSTRAPL